MTPTTALILAALLAIPAAGGALFRHALNIPPGNGTPANEASIKDRAA